jgi:hypothetical protein
MIEPHEQCLAFLAVMNGDAAVDPMMRVSIRHLKRIRRAAKRLFIHHAPAELMGMLDQRNIWVNAKATWYLILEEPREPAHEAIQAAWIQCLQQYVRRLQQPLNEVPGRGLRRRHFDAALRFVERLFPPDRVNAMKEEIRLTDINSLGD